MNKFEKASRLNLQFNTHKGSVGVSTLWTMQLQNSSGFDLDTLAGSIDELLSSAKKKSFVSTEDKKSADYVQNLELQMSIVMHVIKSKLADIAKRERDRARQNELEKLTGILASKNDEELRGMNKRDIEKKILELSK